MVQQIIIGFNYLISFIRYLVVCHVKMFHMFVGEKHFICHVNVPEIRKKLLIQKLNLK